MELKMNVEVKTNVDVEIHIEDIAEKISEMTIQKRFNFIATLFNGIELDNIDKLTQEQNVMITSYFQRNIIKLLEARAEKV